MSLPREILDPLLSGYLDDALSADERSRVESLLRSDPEVARELGQLRQLRASLRQVYRADAKPLGEKFAERVIESAVMRAHAEGLREDHPVVRLAEQPSTANPSRPRSRRYLAAVVLALAASILLAVGLALPLQRDGGIEPVAEKGPAARAEEDGSGDETAAPRQGSGAEQAAPQPALAANAPSSEDVPDRERLADGLAPQRLEIPVEGAGEPMRRSAEPESNSQRIASVGQPQRRRDAPTAEADSPPETRGTTGGPVLVFDVRRTERGRAMRAVQAAMRAASIGSASQKTVSEEIVRAVVESVESAEDGGGRILYLQAPAKQLDRFFLTLVNDAEGVESVAMSLVTDGPVLEMVQSLRPVDPTEVRHQTAWQLDADDAQAIDALSHELADRSFLPFDAATASMGVAGAAPQSAGADVMSQVLVLVH